MTISNGSFPITRQSHFAWTIDWRLVMIAPSDGIGRSVYHLHFVVPISICNRPFQYEV
jgi:hypothetical protein